MKKCPYCVEEIQDEAIKCKHCRSNIGVMVRTKETSPYRQVTFCIWILEKLCGRTLKRNSVKVSIQDYEKEEMVYTDTRRFNLVGYEIPINVAVVVAIVVIIFYWVIYHFTKCSFFYSAISIPVFVLMVAVFDKSLPDFIRCSVNSLLAKQRKDNATIAKKIKDKYEQKNKN